MIDAAFAQRRKALRGALRGIASAEQLDQAFTAIGMDPLVRGEALGIEEFSALTEALAAAEAFDR